MLVWLIILFWPTWALAQTSDGVENSCNFVNTTSCNIALTGVTAGSAIVVAVSSAGSHTLISVSDGTNTYANSLTTGSGPTISTIVACNVASGNPTITATVSAGVFGTARAKEVIGAAASGCMENRSTNSQTSVGTGTDAITSGTVTPAGSGAYFYGVTAWNCCSSPTVSPGTGYTSDIDSDDNGIQAKSEYFAQGSPATAAATFTTSIAGLNYETHVVLIKSTATAVSGCRLLQNGVDKRRLQNGADGRIFQGGGSCGLGGGGGPTVVPVRMMTGVGL